MLTNRFPVRKLFLSTVVCAGLVFSGGVADVTNAWAEADVAPNPAAEQYRPYLHYSPEKNWMNDPNGLVYYQGTYHLYYQYNPFGNTWGNMSWGHATSPDLLHWTEQPLAIAQDVDADIFSGSIVVDTNNTSGFGTADNPPLVAMYTSAYHSGKQAQSLAYSTDAGQSWTKYAGNPVLDRNSNNFRDPHMFWYDGGSPENSYWVVVTVEATDHQVLMYKSADLKTWDYLSTFGPANATSGIWECPDLFPLAVDGDPAKTKWVMVVNLNPGAVSGGSGGQYFVGDFDGTTFTSESTVGSDTMPAGSTYAAFDGSDYQGWTVNNEPGNWKNGPFGSAPATGPIDGQQMPSGFTGTGFINGFNDGDWPLGSMQSPEFTIDENYVNFLVGGGNHPHEAGTQLQNDPPAGSDLLFEGFEYPGTESIVDHGWTLGGDFTADRSLATAGGDYAIGAKRINTYEAGPKGDDNIGSMTSAPFAITKTNLGFLIGGGMREAASGQILQAELLVDGQAVRTASGSNDGALNWRNWDVAEFVGSDAQIRITDQATGGWGHLTFDHAVLSDSPAHKRSAETSVNLVVDGEIARTATGGNSETLDWTSWEVSEFVGEKAHISIVDNNRGGWGHVLADQFMFSDTAAEQRIRSYDWLDWGRDFYAGVTYDNAPEGKRIMVAWMNNWDYANQIPTGQWRSAMALPRELSLQTIDGRPQLVQQVTEHVADLEQTDAAYSAKAQDVAGVTALPDAANGEVLKIDAVFSPGDADRFGLEVRRSADGTQSTPILYDTASGALSVDRTTSGDTGFAGNFASVDSAPVTLEDGTLHLEIYLDRSSVEVLAQGGKRTLTEQIFPDGASTGIALVAEGGTARLESLTVTPLTGAMYDPAVSAELSSSAPVSPDGWFRSAVTTTLSLTQGAGALEHRTDGGDWVDYSTPFSTGGEGDHQIEYRVADNGETVGSSLGSVAFRIDSQAPVTTATLDPASGAGTPDHSVHVSFTATDSGSGVASTQYQLGAGEWTAAPPEGLDISRVGSTVITYRSTDSAGNVEANQAVSVTVTAPTATATVAINPGTVPAGESTKISGSGFAATEKVRLTLDSGRLLGTVTTTKKGTFTTTVTVDPTTTIGTHTITATGQKSHSIGQATATVTAERSASSISGSASALLVRAGSSVSYSAAVNPAAAVGDITVFDNGKPIVRATLKAGDKGKMRVSFPGLRPGIHVIVSVYGGSDTLKPSTSRTSLVIVW
ncbi:GH32 C-terminal domain-containing protein [Cryobacterium sp. N22]|uniref:GH32 C-terminal domain-containing protein n=1 Tax=Cryobacterium sp. N22 TaxID=2048290 RepID=UPI000CE565C1|nr:GH32 C-terminal domain-containing protein [Cryobacterium sp. N22]